jgi:hypothetical protein
MLDLSGVAPVEPIIYVLYESLHLISLRRGRIHDGNVEMVRPGAVIMKPVGKYDICVNNDAIYGFQRQSLSSHVFRT